MIVGLDHVQLAMPIGGERTARKFYADLLGLPEIPKPEPLASRGGCWFSSGAVVIHLGVEREFVAARKAHPAFLVDDLAAVEQRLQAASTSVTQDHSLADRRRCFVNDPFGNRIELIQDGDGLSQRPARP